MLPYAHLLIGLVVSGGLYLIFPEVDLIRAGILLASSVLIDFDHYLFYLYVYKDKNVKRAYDFFREKKERYKLSPRERRKYLSPVLCIFHGIEWVILFFILGFFVWNYFFYVSAGMLLHLLTDLAEHIMYPNGMHKISVIYDFLIYKN